MKILITLASICLVYAGLTSSSLNAADPIPRSRDGALGQTTAKSTPQRARGTTARGPLPDPALLDGSAKEADKTSEHGMLGEFEIPGDEDVRNGQVGGPQNANPIAAQDSSLPQNGGSPQGTQSQQAGGGGSPGGPDAPAGQSGSAPGGGASDQAAGQIPGGGDPNATAQGIQVAELQGEAQPGDAGAAGMPQKPPPVAIGDSAMQIQGIQNAPAVVGSQVAGQTQQMETAIGGGAKGASGTNSNRGAEKGRVIPAGL